MTRALPTSSDHTNAAAIAAERAARAMRLRAVRSRLAAAHGDLVMAVEGGEYQLLGRDPITGEDCRMARYELDADPGLAALHASAFEDITFLLELFDTACVKINAQAGEIARLSGAGDKPAGPQADYAAEASMRCADPVFVRYLMDKHGLEDGAAPEFVPAALRKALDIASRKDLNTDPAAAARWRALRADFEAWRTHG